MRTISAWLAGLAGAALTNALSLEKRDSPAVLAVPMERRSGRSGLSKRSKVVNIDADDDYWDDLDWMGNITFGTPAQNFQASFQTWGRGCWIQSASSSFCSEMNDPMDCDGMGGYNQSTSTTAKTLDGKYWFNATYQYGETISGNLVSDTMTAGGVKLDTVNVTIVEGWTGSVMSLGYGNQSSNSLTQLLADAGAINTPAFSIYDRTVLFGGVDQARYTGDLYSFPIINGSDSPAEIAINIDSISINNNSVATKSFPLPAVLDNGYGMSFLPKSLAQALTAQISGSSVPDFYGQVNFSCTAINDNDTIEFQFGDLTIPLDMMLFVSEESDDPTLDIPSVDENGTCYFQIVENIDSGVDEDYAILGANFFNNVYTVFDLDNDEVSLATINVAHLKPDIVEITSGKGGVPGAKDSAGARIGRDLGMGALVATAAMLVLAM